MLRVFFSLLKKQLKNRKKEIETCLKEFHIVVDEEENDEKIINEQLKYRDNVENSIRDFNILKVGLKKICIRKSHRILNLISF